MNTFANAVTNSVKNQKTRTTNGMKARKSTANDVLDLFGKIGSARGVDLSKQFLKALAEDETLTLRTLLWARDVRGGAGERQTFRNLLAVAEKHNPYLAGKIMHKIPEVGRWDDLFTYADPINRRKAFDMIGAALKDENSLCAKWMPSKGKVAAELRKHLGLSPKAYRKTLVGLKKVVETQMCAKEWNNISFSEVPSLAAARYQKAFMRNAPEAYSAYKAELAKPESERDPKVKINAGAVYPYDVLKSVMKGDAAVADAQWNALPNYIGDAKVFAVVDVSASMTWDRISGDLTPMHVANSLGLYVSDKNTGPFKDMFMTFSERPEMVTVKGTLSQKMHTMKYANVGGSTNLHASMDLLLDVAVKGNAKQKDMPDMLVIFSDMQFNGGNGYGYGCLSGYDDNAFGMIKRKFKDAGYKMPKIVFWNLNGKYDNTPVKFDKNKSAFVSGFSPALMKSILADDLEDFTPYNVMLKTIMDSRYDF